MDMALPNLLLDQSFEDFGTCMEIVDWDMDFRQLDPGRLDARVSVIAGEHLQLARFQFNRGFHQLGSSPEGMLTFGFSDPDNSEMSWSGTDAPRGSMQIFDLTGGFDCVSSAGFSGYAVIVHPEYLQHLAEQNEICATVDSLKTAATRHSPNTEKMSRRLQSLYRAVDQTGSQYLGEFADLVNEEVGITILRELARTTTNQRVIPQPHKARVLGKVRDILNNVDELPITVSELCSRVGASSSSLNRIFLSEYEISPKCYIRSRCLSAVRDELGCASPGSKVSDIAGKWGFWHMGQFARDFRALFGELPSRYLTSVNRAHPNPKPPIVRTVAT